MDQSGYRGLTVWQRAMELAEEVYRLTDLLPETEKYGLSSQLQRASASIPANIAECYGRSRRGDYLRHLSFARGSLMEVETHLILSVRVNKLDREHAVKAWELAQEVGKMLTQMIRKMLDQDKK